MKTYEIWSEGYSATGGTGGATYHGEVPAKNLKDACKKYAKLHPEFNKYFDKKAMTLWGCGLFDSEEKSRRRFG